MQSEQTYERFFSTQIMADIDEYYDGEPLKQVYSCGNKPVEQCSRLAYITPIVVLGLVFLAFKTSRGFSHFMGDRSVIKIIITLYLATNAKNLNQSMIDNIVLPLIKPIMPWISNHNQNLRLGPFNLGLGNFVTDAVVFAINMFFIYGVFGWTMS